MYVCRVVARVSLCSRGDQRTTFRSHFSPSMTWVLEIELRAKRFYWLSHPSVLRWLFRPVSMWTKRNRWHTVVKSQTIPEQSAQHLECALISFQDVLPAQAAPWASFPFSLWSSTVLCLCVVVGLSGGQVWCQHLTEIQGWPVLLHFCSRKKPFRFPCLS